MKGAKIELADKEQLVEIFEDTLRFCELNEILSEAVNYTKSATKFYPSDFAEEVETHKAGEIRVVDGRTVQTALALRREFPDKKIAVLNFASSTEPGGSVLIGGKAQEETICRSTTLYPSINTYEMKKAYYVPHRDNYIFTGWDECIYSPDVVICKNDSEELPERLAAENFAKIDVITCAAPHLRDEPVRADELLVIYRKRAENILRVCAFNGADIFLGGAFGCGLFHNSPELTAWAWREALSKYREKFSLIVFAVYMRQGKERDKFRAFRSEFPEGIMKENNENAD